MATDVWRAAMTDVSDVIIGVGLVMGSAEMATEEAQMARPSKKLIT
jgi:hypothetical protein